MKILICDKLDALALQELKEMGNCVDISTEENKREKLLSHIPDTDLVFIRSAPYSRYRPGVYTKRNFYR